MPPSRFKGDPPTRPDGRCLECLGERSPTATLHDDPFCSRPCCEAYYAAARGLAAGVLAGLRAAA